MTCDAEPQQTPSTTVGRAEIRAAHALIAPHVRRTPILEAASPVAGAYRPAAGERVGALVCGANADLTTFAAAAAL
jgi:threonine dehydratase